MEASVEAFIRERLAVGLKRLKTWVEQNTHTRNGDGVERHATQLEEAFAALGFAAERPPAGVDGCGRHLFLRRPGSADGPAAALIAHMDTVFPEAEERENDFRWKELEGRIYGPGTWDIKGGSLMILLLLELVQREDPALFERVEWHIALNSSEEILNHHFGVLCRQCFPENTKAALVFEGDSTPDAARECRLIWQRKGRGIFRLLAEGQGAHAGASHEQGVNAIRQLARAVEPLECLTDYRKGLTVNIGRIEGGVDFNRVPHRAEARMEIRAPDGKTLEAAIAAAQTVVRNQMVLVSGDGKTRGRIRLETLQIDPSWDANPGSQLLFEVWQSAGSELGIELKALARGGLSDGNFLWQHIPTIDGLGPAGGNAHSSEWSDGDSPKRPEYILAESYVPKLKLHFAALQRLLSQ
ncbi:MAG: M20/M25/M40 family metallo-hydrolase [Opitutales bacterium]|nr:M20/M25/M40 family metallo-hydrolase [Opitutales bacterium]